MSLTYVHECKPHTDPMLSSPYVFDCIPIFIVVVLFTLIPPGAYVPMGLRQPRDQERRAAAPSSDGLTFEMTGPAQAV